MGEIRLKWQGDSSMKHYRNSSKRQSCRLGLRVVVVADSLSSERQQQRRAVVAGQLEQFLVGVHSQDRVAGLTHAFYRYPARFSPLFARAAIQAFTEPGDLVLDPFMGGATTLVEARALGRAGVGLDINSLSCFIARAKTTLMSDADLAAIREWTHTTVGALSMRRPAERATEWIKRGYHRNIDTHDTWAIRKSIELTLSQVSLLRSRTREVFGRAILLRTSQWALDCRTDVPTASQFRKSFISFTDEMITGAKAFRKAVNSPSNRRRTRAPVAVFNRSAEGADQDASIRGFGAPRLILTSPPYPGVHVVYHRWQVLGRRETPAPYWIANSLDGSGLSYYTFGHRKNPGLKTYFEKARSTFRSLAQLADEETLFVQMLAFSDPSWQLSEYLVAMNDAGLVEVPMPQLANAADGRLWRTVPNRKWYADMRGDSGAGSEVVLFHRKLR